MSKRSFIVITGCAIAAICQLIGVLYPGSFFYRGDWTVKALDIFAIVVNLFIVVMYILIARYERRRKKVRFE